MRTPHQTTTEEHHPPAVSDGGRGQPVLLSAFPALAAFPIPASNEVIGREWFEKKGVKDGQISSLHLRFSWEEDRLHIEDIDSTNGVYLNGDPIAIGVPVELKDGAVLRLGRTLFVYRENFTGPLSPADPLGKLVGPWGLTTVREDIDRLKLREERNVLIEGETGTGKELLAAVVAETLGRKPMGAINAAGIPTSMFEGQLFGWKKGAFSGAETTSPGVLREHEPGAVFLDEFSRLPPEVQPKILRLLDHRDILPLGAAKPVNVDVALIAATNESLEAKVEEGTFQRDLLARFYVRLNLSSLRKRPEDLFAILQKLQEDRSAPLDLSRVEVEAVERLMLKKWRENVRGLARIARSIEPSGSLTLEAVKRALRKTRGTAVARKRKAARSVTFPVAAVPVAAQAEPVPGDSYKEQHNQWEKQLIERTLQQNNWNQVQTAKQLRMPRKTLANKIKALGIKIPKR